ncbi:MAG: protein-tyrosine phosphatase family protein [Promethearchaeota archaeon]
MNKIWPSYWPKGGMPEKAEPFNWIIKGKLAASWWPDKLLFKKYQNEGISVIINCSEFNNQNDVPQSFHYYHINVPDYGVPTASQIERFIHITNDHKNESIVVHCVAGCGRTAQFIIAWASYNGYIPKNIDPVNWIRKLRPCSLETRKQMDFARKLAKNYHRI